MNHTKVLCADEWSMFLRDEVQLPIVAHDEIEKLANKLAHDSQTIDDFVQLTEQQLVTLMFYFSIHFQGV